MIKKILTAALLSALLPVSASAATTYITDYQTYGSCTNADTNYYGFNVCLHNNRMMAEVFAENRATRLKNQYNTNDVTVTSFNCYFSGLCVIQFRVKY